VNGKSVLGTRGIVDQAEECVKYSRAFAPAFKSRRERRGLRILGAYYRCWLGYSP